MKHLLLVGILALLASQPAIACTVEGSAMADRARQKGLVGKLKVDGVFKILSEESWDGSGEYPMTIKGTITTPKGKTYRTTHDDDGVIILCAVYFTPKQDVEGTFYLKRRKKGEYQLIHWDDIYLTEPTPSEIEGN